MLPDIIKRYTLDSPKVQFVLHQSSPLEIAACSTVEMQTLPLQQSLSKMMIGLLHFLSINGITESLFEAHALLNCREITLNSISEYPLITYHKGFTGREKIDKQFVAKKSKILYLKL